MITINVVVENTASRTGVVKAGEFAVVKTSDNLAIQLGAGVGTTVVDAGENHTVTTKTNYVLTDASFDHTASALNVVTPDTPREKVLRNDSLSTLVDGNPSDSFGAAEALVNRGTNTYSAFTWTMKFTVSFSASATKKQGLFIDLNSSDTYMHEKVTFTAEQIANGVAKDGLFTDEKCEAGHEAVADETDNTLLSKTTYVDGATLYRVAPDATGKAFRIALVPTLIEDSTNGSIAYTKIWADNETSSTNEGKFIDGVDVGGSLENPTAYATETGSLAYVTDAWTYASATAGTGKVLMKSGDNSVIPTDNTVDQDNAYYLANNSNYLGFFNVNPGNNVSITFTCVAWYEGSHPEIVNSATDFEDIVTSMKFGLSELIA